MKEELEKAIEAVAEEYGVSPEGITGKSRVKPLPEARQMFFYLLRRKVAHNRMANRLNRNRSYVKNGITVMDGLIYTYRDTMERYNKLLNKLGYDD